MNSIKNIRTVKKNNKFNLNNFDNGFHVMSSSSLDVMSSGHYTVEQFPSHTVPSQYLNREEVMQYINPTLWHLMKKPFNFHTKRETDQNNCSTPNPKWISQKITKQGRRRKKFKYEHLTYLMRNQGKIQMITYCCKW